MDLKDVLKRGGKNAVISCIAILLGIGGLFLFAGPKASSFEAGVIPRCESEFARDLLTKVIQESPGAKQGLIKLVRLGGTKTVWNQANKDQEGYTPGKIALMVCEASIFTNAGQHDIHFHMKWIDEAKKERSLAGNPRLA
jgi:hypothetical protein